jgi:hypothetical protein
MAKRRSFQHFWTKKDDKEDDQSIEMPTKDHKESGYCVIIVLHHNRLQQTTFSWKIATEDHFHDGHIVIIDLHHSSLKQTIFSEEITTKDHEQDDYIEIIDQCQC